MDWNYILQNSFAVAAASGLAYAIWRVAVWFGPLVEGLVADHRKLVETLRVEIPIHKEIARDHSEKLERIAQAVEGNSVRLDGINTKLPEVCLISKEDKSCMVTS